MSSLEEPGYAAPEDAALSGFDARFARVTRVRATDPDCTLILDEDHLEVELATNEPPIVYPYFVNVERRGGFWFETSLKKHAAHQGSPPHSRSR